MRLIGVVEFWTLFLSGKLVLRNQIDGDVKCSWKAGGQDFYAYGKLKDGTE